MGEIKLTEEDIKIKNRQIQELNVRLEIQNLQLEQLNKMLELDLPNRQVRVQLADLISQIESSEQNIKVLARQIRDKKIITKEEEK